ncbi:class I tRNA ligase family protein [Plantactinospora sp. KBS50]|uniref:class I tRNA ligase family protein n=1 Tax=Plantactinospora sp. KBS50 TaxID=2024580 RepID=UPI0012FD5910|nr:class I tRNA ligase family protein [Plantactinospora sp. KBS50]
MQPTPNGRMHIGHGGGTYLRADVLARSLRAEGHDVRVACGSDAYENWILAASAQDGRTPADTCAVYHSGILSDLTALDINFDVWIDPLNEPHRQAYLDIHTELFREVSASGGAALETELVPYAEADDSPLLGTFIAGDCPNCGAPAGGSSCTGCSEHFQPSQLLNPHARLSDTAIVWREEKNWFLRPRSAANLLAELESTGLAAEHVAVAARYLERSGGRIRLSGPGTWGVTSPLLPDGWVLSNSYFLYCLYASRQVADEAAPEPFAAGSGVVTVGIFGTDNSAPGLIVPGLYAQATEGRLRAFNHTVVNGMLDLDGQKCSTSKRYGIWLKDVLGSGMVSSDELRFALSGVDLDRGRANLNLPDLVATINGFRGAVRDRVVPALTQAPALAGVDQDVLATQRRSLQPASLNLPSARAVLDDYLFGPAPDPARWLASLAALAAPLTPRLSAAITAAAAGTAGNDVLNDVLGVGDLTADRLESVVRRGGSSS